MQQQRKYDLIMWVLFSVTPIPCPVGRTNTIPLNKHQPVKVECENAFRFIVFIPTWSLARIWQELEF